MWKHLWARITRSLFCTITYWIIVAIAAFTLLGWTWGHGTGWSRLWTNWVVGPDVNPLDRVKVTLTTIGGVGAVGYLVIKYRERASLGYAIFERADLRKVTFESSELHDSTFKYANLVDVTFMETKLNHTTFTSAEIRRTTFESARIEHTIFVRATLKNVRFKNKYDDREIKRIDFTDTSFDDVDFKGVSLVYPVFWTSADEETLIEVMSDLGIETAGRKLENIVFDESRIYNANFKGGNLRNICFRETEFYQTSFDDANLEGAKFYRTFFYETSFSNARFGASFNPIYLEDSSFAGARLCESDFTGAEIYRSDFTRAELERNIFIDAILQTTDFTGATLVSPVF